MSWTTAVSDLRALLHDGAKDRYRYRKRCFGAANGTNVSFKTMEYRRINDFTAAVAPLGVYLNDILQAPSAIASDSTETGEFTLTAPAPGNTEVTATYYIQYFNDAELTEFLTNAAKWMAVGSDFTLLPDGLQMAALKYGAYQAYQKLAMRFVETQSDAFRLEDTPKDKQISMVDNMRGLSKDFLKQATESRDDYYSRSGKENQPSWGFQRGRVRDPQPKR